MCAKKASPSTPAAPGSPPPASTVKRLRGTLLAVLILAAGCGIWYAVWQHVKSHVLAEADYQLDPQTIELSPPPPKWIHANIKSEVIRDGSLPKSLSILDPEVTVHVKRAFGLHPWIAEVERVTKRHPAGVKVEVSYRQPVAMVEVTRGLLPIDAEGVLLPSDDFSPKQAEGYPRLGGIKSIPLGPVGTRWGDARVTGGAQIAAAMQDDWQRLKLYRVVASQNPVGGKFSDDYSFDLFTHGGTRIVWGRVSDGSLKGEATTGQKAAKLLEIAGPTGVLDDEVPGKVIDLAGPLQRTAIKPLPKQDSSE